MGKLMRFFKYGLAILLLSLNCSINYAFANPDEKPSIRIAMLHLELEYADLEHNAALIESGIELAAEHGADWVMTPELSYTGYRFDLKIGTDWIPFGPDAYVKRVQSLAQKNNITVFLSHLERVKTEATEEDNDSDIFNTLFVIDQAGEIIARHKKINTIPISESWSTAGTQATTISVGQHKVGLLVCADAWPTTHAQDLKEQGADIILSSANWAPGEYGPGDTWEKRSKETGLPVFVNNRTGIERQFDLRESVSVVSYQGERLLSHQSSTSELILIDWNTQNNTLLSYRTQKISH